MRGMIRNWANTPRTTALGIFKTSPKSGKVSVIPIPNMMMPKPAATMERSLPGIFPRNQVKCPGAIHAHAVPSRVHNQKRFTNRTITPPPCRNSPAMKSGLVLPHKNDSPPCDQDRCFHIPRRITVCHGASNQRNRPICPRSNLIGLIRHPRPRSRSGKSLLIRLTKSGSSAQFLSIVLPATFTTAPAGTPTLTANSL